MAKTKIKITPPKGKKVKRSDRHGYPRGLALPRGTRIESNIYIAFPAGTVRWDWEEKLAADPNGAGVTMMVNNCSRVDRTLGRSCRVLSRDYIIPQKTLVMNDVEVVGGVK